MRFNKEIKIEDFVISENSRTFIVAEAGVNHGGDVNLAKKLVEIASRAGADAVKFQAFRAENVILKNVRKAPYQRKTTSADESQFDMLKKLELTTGQNIEIKKHCKRKNIIFLSTAFDEESLDMLGEIGVPAFKVASTDITNLPFLRKVAKKGKPILISAGMSYLAEVKAALREIHPFNKDVVLLQCTANYPISDEEANLNVISALRDSFDVLIGFSDHSVGVGAAPYAVAMGAKVIEKHFTADKTLKGPDHKASLTPEELNDLIAEIRKVEKYMGSCEKAPTDSEAHTRASLQKCLVTRRSVEKGEIFGEDNVTAKRTGGLGISPIFYRRLFGTAASKRYGKDEIIKISGKQ